ncbi:hypothetical protein VTN96DRAFT_4232 [Rasamsonia emersonii]
MGAVGSWRNARFLTRQSQPFYQCQFRLRGPTPGVSIWLKDGQVLDHEPDDSSAHISCASIPKILGSRNFLMRVSRYLVRQNFCEFVHSVPNGSALLSLAEITQGMNLRPAPRMVLSRNASVMRILVKLVCMSIMLPSQSEDGSRLQQQT